MQLLGNRAVQLRTRAPHHSIPRHPPLSHSHTVFCSNDARLAPLLPVRLRAACTTAQAMAMRSYPTATGLRRSARLVYLRAVPCQCLCHPLIRHHTKLHYMAKAVRFLRCCACPNRLAMGVLCLDSASVAVSTSDRQNGSRESPALPEKLQP